MANVDVTVAVYKIDNSGFDATVEEIQQGYAEMEKANKAATASANALGQATGVLADKVGTLAVAEKEAAQSATDLAKSGTTLGGVFKNIGTGIKDFALGARDGFKQAIAEVGGFRGILSQTLSNIKSFVTGATPAFDTTGKSIDQLKARIADLQKKKGTLIDKAAIGQTNKEIALVEKRLASLSGATTSKFGAAFASVKQSINGVVSSIPGIGGIAAALGPAGIAAAAVAGGLFKVITNTDAGATALQGLGKTGGVVFDRVTGAVTGFFDELRNGTGFIGKSFDFLSGVVDVFINKLTPFGDIFRALSETSLFKGLKEDFEFGQQIANQLDELDDKQRDVNLTVAQNEVGLRKNLAALRDTTKSAEERLAIADEITKVEEQNLNQKRELLRTELAIAQAQANRQQSLKGEVDDSLKQQITDLNVAIANAEADSVSLTERVATRRAGIVEQEEQRKAAIREKARAAQEKAEQAAAKRNEQRLQAEAKLNETVEALAAESRDRQLSEGEREVEAVKKKYADLEKATLEGIAKLREASPANAQSEITRREADAILAIEKGKNEELLALEKARQEELGKTREEALESIRQSLLTETEAQREAVLVQLDEQVALAERYIENEVERNTAIAELRRKAEEELTTIITDEEAKRREIEAAAQEQRVALAEQNTAIVANLAEQSLQTIIAAAAQGQDIQEQAGKQLLVILLDTLEKIILANAFQVQAISAGAPTPDNLATGGIAGIARGVILAAIVRGLFGAAKSAITANYDGDPYVGGDGSRPMWSGRDGYLRRLDKGERVVRTKTNERHYEGLEAMERGTFDQWIDRNYILPAIEDLRINDDAKAVRYSQGELGERMARSITLPRMFDKGIVGAMNNGRKEQRQTNELLQALVNNTRPRRSNPRYN